MQNCILCGPYVGGLVDHIKSEDHQLSMKRGRALANQRLEQGGKKRKAS